MKDLTVPFSLLSLSPVADGQTVADSLKETTELARAADAWGYHRMWMAEHHNIDRIASSATSVLITHLAANTSRIRVGSGGVMLSNHAPLMVAEQFGTLESLYPGRIDLGVGRATGADALATQALRRPPMPDDGFAGMVSEVLGYLGPEDPAARVRAIPGTGTNVPVWLLGTSTVSASLAARLGLPFAFASHFVPHNLPAALETYRARFEPSERLSRPYTMATVNVTAADDDARARFLFTTLQQKFLTHMRGKLRVPAPVEDMGPLWSAEERRAVDAMLSASVVGGPETVRDGLLDFVESTGVDEVMVVCETHDLDSRLRSHELIAKVFSG